MRRKGKMRILAVLLTATFILAGCGSSKDSYSNGGAAYTEEASDSYYASDDFYETAIEEDVAEDGYDQGQESREENSSVQSNRKLIKKVSLTVETTEFDKLIDHLTAKIDRLGGYVESSEIYGGGIYDGSTRSAEYTVRIPSASLDSFVSEVSEESNVTHKSQNVEDITLQYVDLQSKKEALSVEQERLLALLEEADSLESVITLESRLTDVRYELQSMESRLRTYDNLVDYSTVNISIHEVEIYTPPEPTGIWEEISTGFVGSLKGVGNGILDFVIGFIVALPYLVVWGIIITVIVLIVRKIKKHRKAKEERKQELARQKKQEQDDQLKDLIATEREE